MKEVKRCYQLLSHLPVGQLQHWRNLKKYSNSAGRDVQRLLKQGLLQKVGPALYLVPQKSRFGELPVDDFSLVKTFLKSDDFLLISPNLYNTLGVGLTQLKNETVVYNKKRHDLVQLSSRNFHFKRPNNGYPSSLTAEFLLVDLMNNIKSVGEIPEEIEDKIIEKIKDHQFNSDLILKLANEYGKVGVKKFFNNLIFKDA